MRTRISTKGSGMPAIASMSKRVSSSTSARSCGSVAVDATGDVSVMPQPCTMSMP